MATKKKEEKGHLLTCLNCRRKFRARNGNTRFCTDPDCREKLRDLKSKCATYDVSITGSSLEVIEKRIEEAKKRHIEAHKEKMRKKAERTAQKKAERREKARLKRLEKRKSRYSKEEMAKRGERIRESRRKVNEEKYKEKLSAWIEYEKKVNAKAERYGLTLIDCKCANCGRKFKRVLHATSGILSGKTKKKDEPCFCSPICASRGRSEVIQKRLDSGEYEIAFDKHGNLAPRPKKKKVLIRTCHRGTGFYAQGGPRYMRIDEDKVDLVVCGGYEFGTDIERLDNIEEGLKDIERNFS